MAKTKDDGNAPLVVRIEGEMTIYRAVELKTALLAPLDAATCIDVDLSMVDDIDCAGIQVLMLAKKTASAGLQNWRIRACSHAVADALDLLDLAAWFGDPPAVTPPA